MPKTDHLPSPISSMMGISNVSNFFVFSASRIQSSSLHTRNPALCPKTVVEVLLKRRHQHHLAADHLVWSACAEVGLKKIKMSLYFYQKSRDF